MLNYSVAELRLDLEYIEAWNGYLCFNMFPVLFCFFFGKENGTGFYEFCVSLFQAHWYNFYS